MGTRCRRGRRARRHRRPRRRSAPPTPTRRGQRRRDVPEPRHPGIPSGPQRVPRRRRVRPGGLVVHLFPRGARLPIEEPGRVGADRPRTRSAVTTRPDVDPPVVFAGHLRPDPPPPRWTLLDDHDQRDRRRGDHVLRHGGGPGRAVVRSHHRRRERHRPRPGLGRRRELLGALLRPGRDRPLPDRPFGRTRARPARTGHGPGPASSTPSRPTSSSATAPGT